MPTIQIVFHLFFYFCSLALKSPHHWPVISELLPAAERRETILHLQDDFPDCLFPEINEDVCFRLYTIVTFLKWQHQIYFCKFGKFHESFISQIFNFQIISKFLNSPASTHAVYKAYGSSLLTRTLFSRDKEFVNISKNKVLANIYEFTVIGIQA